ncbi:unnamed protein product [Calypogeia fissa]
MKSYSNGVFTPFVQSRYYQGCQLGPKLGPAELKEVSAAVPTKDVASDRYADSYTMSISWKHAVTPSLESWIPHTA